MGIFWSLFSLTYCFNLGVEYRARFGHLWDGVIVVSIFAAGNERVIVTARRFGQGFVGYNYSTNAAVNIISPEVDDQGCPFFYSSMLCSI
ncbi:hypothetical protein V1525DRAFT_260091 [Lipomyces kononenkoae]|uniref:Uncharacterized protein n=1 Tax=Lipomyces kononenkoae TaxID=34357 RepID=A0ACC3SV47_LIPKO